MLNDMTSTRSLRRSRRAPKSNEGGENRAVQLRVTRSASKVSSVVHMGAIGLVATRCANALKTISIAGTACLRWPTGDTICCNASRQFTVSPPFRPPNYNIFRQKSLTGLCGSDTFRREVALPRSRNSLVRSTLMNKRLPASSLLCALAVFALRFATMCSNSCRVVPDTPDPELPPTGRLSLAARRACPVCGPRLGYRAPGHPAPAVRGFGPGSVSAECHGTHVRTSITTSIRLGRR